MKTHDELDTLLLSLYWHCEHGEHAKAIQKLKDLQEEAHGEGCDETREQHG